MGKRKSKTIESDAPENVPEAAQEFDVAGPLTLEEAKAVGDVPEDFKANHSTPSAGGILKHSTPAEGDSVVPSVGDPEAPGERKSVTFAEQPPEEISNEEKPSRRKSLLELLHLKKKKETEPVAEVQEEAGENMQGEGTGDTAAAETENLDEPVEGEEPAKPKKRKSVLSSLFHRKGKEEAPQEEAESPEEAAQAIGVAATEAEQVKQTETPGPTAQVAESPTSEQAETPVQATMADEGAESKAPNTDQAAEGSTEKKSFFGRLFSKRSSRASQSDNDEVGAAAAGVAAASAGAVVAGAAVDQEHNESTGDDVPGATSPQASEEASPQAKKKKPFWATTYPEPSPDAVALKEGGVRKKGYIFQSFRPRYMRIMSDGILQYARKEGEWEDAKGLRLTHDMDVETQDGSGKNPYILKVDVPGGKSCVFGFDAVEERDGWKGAFEEMKTKLQANAPDDGNQHVIKSGILEGESSEDPTHNGQEGTSA